MEGTIKNVGPIESLGLPIPEGGGVVVLRGRNGAGKSQALAAVDSLTGGKSRVAVRDGELRGTVEAFGAKLSVAKSTRRSGELEVSTLEGRFSVETLATGDGYESAEAQDAARIKALVQLAGVKPDPALFHPLVDGPERFAAVTVPADTDGDDLIKISDRIKRRFEGVARNEAGKAEHEERAAGSSDMACEGLNLDEPCNAATLQTVMESAFGVRERLRTRKVEAERAAQTLAHAERMTAEVGNVDVLAAVNRLADAVMAADELDAKLGRAKEVVARLKAELVEAESVKRERQAALDRERDKDRLLSEVRAEVAKAELVAPAPDDAAIAAADLGIAEARKAIERGQLVRDGRAARERANRHRELAADFRKNEEYWRDAAKGVDEVLSGIVGKLGCGLKVESGRLTLRTARGNTYFAELSEGERWRAAVDLGVAMVGAGGLLVVGQAAWESLDPDNRRYIADRAKEASVVVLTAEATDGDLRAETYPNE